MISRMGWMNKRKKNLSSKQLFKMGKSSPLSRNTWPIPEDLIELLHEFYGEDLSDGEIASRFDQKDFEETCMFLWLSYDNDGDGANFRTFVKKTRRK